jgi:hypothetical protein
LRRWLAALKNRSLIPYPVKALVGWNSGLCEHAHPLAMFPSTSYFSTRSILLAMKKVGSFRLKVSPKRSYHCTISSMLVLLLISKTNIVASDLCMYKGTKF